MKRKRLEKTLDLSSGVSSHNRFNQVPTARPFAEAVRKHWSIENRLHWQQDVAFGKDQCRVRQGHASTSQSLNRRQTSELL